MWITRLTLVFVLITGILAFEDVSEKFTVTTSIPNVIQEPKTEVPETTERTTECEKETKMSDRILAIVEYFKQPQPQGIPGVDIPDPYPVPDMQQFVTVGTLFFEKTTVHGLSKFRIVHMNADLDKMELQAEVLFDKLEARGKYIYSVSPFMWFNRDEGPFTVNVTALSVTGRVTLAVQLDGRLRVSDIYIDVVFDTIKVDFKNLGVMGNVLQGIVNTASDFLFESIKPQILNDAYVNLRDNINEKIDEFVGDIKFPNTISPLDMVIVDARNKMQEVGLDPYQVQDSVTSAGVFTITVYDIWISGISTFYRIGNISFNIVNGTVISKLNIGSQELKVSLQWSLSVAGVSIMSANASFSIDHMNGRTVIAQPLDVRKKPVLQDFFLEIGNIQARSDGAGTMDYLIEFGVNILPNLLRSHISNTIAEPIKARLQDELNSIDMESKLKQELPKIDNIKELRDFKLSTLKVITRKFGDSDTDDFFNF